MPLSRQSNNVWKAKIPGQALAENCITYECSAPILRNMYIDQHCFESLLRGADGISDFWIHRAELMTEDLLRRMIITT